ncbi:hypothetical protein [Flavobacterium psychrotolerans]|nr:hypothetical protein [Flavobacterium psychrotolerans]
MVFIEKCLFYTVAIAPIAVEILSHRFLAWGKDCNEKREIAPDDES